MSFEDLIQLPIFAEEAVHQEKGFQRVLDDH